MARNNICSSICWFIILIVVVYPIAIATNILWVLLQPLEGCCDCIKSMNRFFERLVTWPRDFGYAISNGQTNCPQP